MPLALLDRPLFRPGGFSRYSDLFLACLVVGIVAMMIIPLPTFLLDILLTMNISLAVVLLLVCIYVQSALKIATLPTILLITTLLRLALNVSSTRLILLNADAGAVIESFGNFVVAGNLVVGGVVFLILTLIQFVVIAKGSERVAEVAARFTLDAMPGKQMAIDADLRAGTIDMDAARALRANLQRESQLYGSMDGAMKFVKGDAIAGILIIIINIVGGLLIGVFQRGMPAAEAAELYSILTIGDGLVCQIPALLISTAAGIVVTRVASEDEGGHLGRDIGKQVTAQPRALGIASGLLVLLALIPGLPTLPFLLLGGVLGLGAYRLSRPQAKKRARPRRPFSLATPDSLHKEPTDDFAPIDDELVPPPPVSVEVGAGLLPLLDPQGDGGRVVNELIPGLRELMHTQLGLVIPGVHVRTEAAGLPENTFRVLLSDIPMALTTVDLAVIDVLGTREHWAGLGLTVLGATALPGIDGPVCQLPESAREQVVAHGGTVVDLPTRVVLQLSQVLRAAAPEFVGIQETQQLLDALERSHPTLVHEVIPKLATVQLMSEILRRLVEEGVSIRNLPAILGAIADYGQAERDPVQMAEHVRSALKRQLSHQFAPGGAELRVLLLDPMIEQTIRDSIQRTDAGNFLALEPELSREIVQAVHAEYARHHLPDAPRPVVITASEIRRYVRRLLEHELPDLAVLSFNDLLPDVQMLPLCRVSVG